MNLPQNFLEQILLSLKKGGILKSLRGANGGYILARDDIYVLDILETLDGELFSIEFKERKCEILDFWVEKKAEINSIFKVKLKELDKYSTQNIKSFVYTI